MADLPYESKVEDTVPKLNNDVAIGEDIEFQRKWWRFEKAIWPILLLVVVFDLLGGFGRGWLAKARRTTGDGALTLDYERIERAGTPSIMTFHFGASAIRDGRIMLYVSDSVVKELGAMRISPQPAISSIGAGGVTYIFPTTGSPASVQIELQPSFPGVQKFRVQAEGGPAIDARIAVMP
jgi:hypothetical protein